MNNSISVTMYVMHNTYVIIIWMRAIPVCWRYLVCSEDESVISGLMISLSLSLSLSLFLSLSSFRRETTCQIE